MSGSNGVPESVPGGCIALRGVEVHNLKGVNLDIPHRKLVVFCGLSGSGKTSLALDTLYAEGQRRYIETFSAYTRQFFERLEKPAAERISGIPPAIAVTHKDPSRSNRATVGTATEAYDHLRLLLAKIGRVICSKCGREVRRESPESAAAMLAVLPTGTRFMVTFAASVAAPADPAALVASLKEEGFVRAIIDNHLINFDEPLTPKSVPSTLYPVPNSSNREHATADPESQIQNPEILVVVDRLTAGSTTPERLRESLETAFAKGDGTAQALVEDKGEDNKGDAALFQEKSCVPFMVDDRSWLRLAFSSTMRCDTCGQEYPVPEPRLFSFNSPLGACPECEGFGNVIDVDMDLVVPDANKSIREGAITPWNTPAYAHELKELLALADDYKLPVDVPFRELTEAHRAIVRDGVPEREFGGLRGFFAWLERRKYKMHLRVFLSRWRSYSPCPACNGRRLRPELRSGAWATRTSPKWRPSKSATCWPSSALCRSPTTNAASAA